LKRRAIFISVALVPLGLLILLGRFGYTSICTTCGAIQNSSEWQIPFTEITYWRSSSVAPTTLSRVVERHHLSLSHAHTWVFAAGGGNGTTCAIGPGRHLCTAVTSQPVANFIDAMARYHGQSEAQRWLSALLNPDRSNYVSGMIRMADVPTNEFDSPLQFETWWRSHRDDLGMSLEQN
jgi:hypothetical protein